VKWKVAHVEANNESLKILADALAKVYSNEKFDRSVIGESWGVATGPATQRGWINIRGSATGWLSYIMLEEVE
jgi:hypothetical protein